MKYLTISNEVKIPLDVVTKRLAFVGTTGSGKSYGAMKLAEEMLDAGIQVITLDPVGIHWGLRISANKKAAGFPITVFGGLYGDVPITPQSGALIADVIIDKVISAVIDVSQFEHDAEKARFASAFAARFFFRKKAKPSPVHIFLEEGQEFVPQNPQREETTMQHNFVRMSKIGRNFGIGVSIITQRPQEVSKKALNLSQALFAFQTNGHHERKAIEEWMKDKGLDLDIASDLPKLPIGQPHLWSPGWLKVSLQVKILKRKTFHPSEEQTTTYEPLKLNNLSPVDIAKLSESIKETVEKAKENDPGELKRKISELQAKVKKLEAAPAPAAPADTKAIYAQAEAVVRKELLKSIRKYEKEMEMFWKELGLALADISILCGKLGHIKRPTFPEMPAVNSLQSKENYSIHIPEPAQPQEELKPRGLGRIPLSAAADSSVRLPEGERKVLTAIAQHADGVNREQLTVLTGYKRSTRDRYIQLLGQKGLIGTDSGGRINATDAGVTALGDSFDPLPKGQELIEYWTNRLPGGEKAIFMILVQNGSVSRESISEMTGYKRSTRDRYIQLLAARKLVINDGGKVSLNMKHFE